MTAERRPGTRSGRSTAGGRSRPGALGRTSGDPRTSPRTLHAELRRPVEPAPARPRRSVAWRAPDVRVRVAGREAEAPVEPVRGCSFGPRRELDRDRARVPGDPLCL